MLTQNGIVPDEAEIRGLVRKYKGTDVTDAPLCCYVATFEFNGDSNCKFRLKFSCLV